MKKTLWIVIIGIIVVLGLYLWSGYNGLVTANEVVDTQWAQVEAQYQRRFDLIPNVVNTVKGVMAQEQAVFLAIADARTKYGGARSVDEKVQSAGELESAISRLLVVVENYPQLKSSETAQSLIAELAGTENRISVERMRFNETVQTYNLKVKRFPGSILASIFGFDERPRFKSVEGAQNAPQVNF